jgi:glucose/arabinose dehydrogenase
MRRAGAMPPSANRITRLRDADGDGAAEVREVFLEGLSQPFGMALVGETLYVGNTDGVVAFPYAAGEHRVTGPGRTLVTFKPKGHWTRSLLASPDGSKLYAGVGSLSNISEHGFEAEEGRAAIYEIDLASGTSRLFATGLRNPVGLALCWLPAGTLPGFPEGMVIGQHGSWNRSILSGYKVIFVPFENGRPSGPSRDILTGFLAADEREAYGRPVGVTLASDGALLVADDVGNVIWRVTGA